MKSKLIAAAVLMGLPVELPAQAAPRPVLGLTTTGQPESITLTGQVASVPGFRSALWGMTANEVRAALARDFGGAKASELLIDPVSGNRAMIAPMNSLAPGPGAAAVTYVFGAASKRLIHVNLDWTVKSPTVRQRDAFRDAGATAVAGFAGNQWKLGSVMRGVVVNRDLIVLFAGADDKGGGVDVRLTGVGYSLSGQAEKAMVPGDGPASLHIGFSAPAATTETATLKPGSF